MKSFSRITLKTSTFIFCVALYQATLLNLTFYKQVFLTISSMALSYHDVLFLVTIPMVIFSAIILVLSCSVFRWLIKLISILFCLIGSFLTYFMFTYQAVIDRGMLQNALETNQAESSALLTWSLISYVVMLGIIPTLLILWIQIKPIENRVKHVIAQLITAFLSLVVIALIALFFYKNYATFFRNNNILLKYLLPSSYISAIYSQYNYIKNANVPFIEIGTDATIESSLNDNRKKTIVLLFVGETARAKNFSLGDYKRETNPLLAKEKNGFYFRNTSSCGTYTAYSVPCMFSNMPRVKYDALKAQKQSNVLDILNYAGVAVNWFDNDGGCKGVCERVATQNVTAKYKTTSPLCNGDVCYDDILLTELAQELDNIKGNSLIALHMIGSHGPTYYQRYPDSYRQFTPTCDTNDITKCDQQALINTYDNTILYTDAVIAKAIEMVKVYQDEYNIIVMYISDHGESLGDNGLYLHSTPYIVAPSEQTQIPFYVWLSDGFMQDNQINAVELRVQSNNIAYSQDNLFHSLLGAFHVKTQEYNKALDIFSFSPNNERVSIE